MRTYVKNFKVLLSSSIQTHALATESHCRRFGLLSSQLENNGIFTTHDRQTHRQYLGKLLLSPPNISNLKFHYATVHAQIILSGFESNIFLNNILITSYSRCDTLQTAASLFDKMLQRNLISWSSMISAYNKKGYNEEALMLFGEFRRSSNENPNEFVLATVIQSCTQLESVENRTHLHGLVIKAGYSQNSHVGTCLIDFYGKNSDLDAASSVFYELEVKSVVSWTVLIMGFSMNGRSDVSLDLFKEMVSTNVVPDNFTLSSVLSACSMLEFLEGGKQIHAYMLRSFANMDVSMSNMLIDFYAKCGELKAGHQIFNHLLIKNDVSWTMMISGYMQNGFHWEALNLSKDMNRLGWRLDRFSCTSVLASCGSVGALSQGKQVHAYTVKVNLDSDEFVTNNLIDMYCKCNSLIEARRVFLEAEKLSANCYNAMIEGYTKHGSSYEALYLFNEMRRNFIPPNVLTFISLLGVSALHISVKVIQQLHSLMIKYGFCSNSFGGSALIDVYSKFSFVKDARLVFEEINEKDIVVWNSMLFGYAIQSENEATFRLYLELRRRRETPNGFTFVAIIMASTNLSSLLHGLQFHNQALNIGLDFDPYVTNALMDMYAKCGIIKAAELLFDSVLDKDSACWNSMISMHAHHGDAKKALQIFKQMRIDDIKPNYITFVGVLSACAHVGLVREGFHHFESMSKFGIEPGTEHYTCMVSLLSRAGELYEAKSFIDKMPVQPGPEVWKSLLSACRVSGNVELGEVAAEMAVMCDPKDSGSYVLLSNIFAGKNMWVDVKKSREKMERNDVVKETGYSQIEIKDRVHLFVARDRTHQEIDLIYDVIYNLIQHIKGTQYELNYDVIQ